MNQKDVPQDLQDEANEAAELYANDLNYKYYFIEGYIAGALAERERDKRKEQPTDLEYAIRKGYYPTKPAVDNSSDAILLDLIKFIRERDYHPRIVDWEYSGGKCTDQKGVVVDDIVTDKELLDLYSLFKSKTQV